MPAVTSVPFDTSMPQLPSKAPASMEPVLLVEPVSRSRLDELELFRLENRCKIVLLDPSSLPPPPVPPPAAAPPCVVAGAPLEAAASCWPPPPAACPPAAFLSACLWLLLGGVPASCVIRRSNSCVARLTLPLGLIQAAFTFLGVEVAQLLISSSPTTYGAPVLRRFWASAKVTRIIYPALSSRYFRAS